MNGQPQNKTAEKMGVKGEYKVISLKRDPTPDELTRLRRYVRTGDLNARKGLPIQAEHEIRNLVPTVGRNVLTRILSGDFTYTGEINYGAFGSAASAFNNASTQLGTEVYRKLKSDSAFDDNLAYTDWFIASGDVADQTFNEFAAFIDGDAGANTGIAFSLVLTGGWVKSGSMFISLKTTIT